MPKKLIGVLLFFLIIGILTRSYELAARSLWFDEAFSWRLIQFPIAEMIARDAADVHPPLYYLLLWGWGKILGTSLLTLRFFSVFFAGVTILFTYLFARVAFSSSRIGLLSAALVAVSGYQIQFAWEARMYTLGTSLLLLSSYLLLKAVRTNQRRYWLTYALATVTFAYVHYFSFFSIAAQVLFIIGFILVRTRFRVGEIVHWSLFWNALLSGILMFLLYLPWLPTFLQQNSQVQNDFWIPRIGGWSIPDTFYRMLWPTSGIPNHEGIFWITIAATPILLTALVWLALALKKNSRDAYWFVLLGGMVPFLITIAVSILSRSVYQDRFFVFANIFMLIGVSALIGSMKRKALGTSIGIILVVFFFGTYVRYWHELDIVNRPGARKATQELFQNHQPGQPILVTSPFVYFSVLHYAQENFSNYDPKLYSETGQLLHFSGGPILLPEDIIGPDIFNHQGSVIWVVDTTGFGSTRLTLPDQWQPVESITYPEVFVHQADVFLTKYQRVN